LNIDGGLSLNFSTDLSSGYSLLNNIGFSMHHMNQPNEGFIYDSRLPILFTIHAGSLIPIGKNWKQQGEYIFPYASYNWQGLVNNTFKVQREFIAGFYVFKNNLLYGVLYRAGYLPLTTINTNQLGLSVGYQ